MDAPPAPIPSLLDVQRVLNPPWSRWMVRLLRPGFVLAFCGLVPFVWSLATGYTFNWRALTFGTTAVLALDSTPPGAAIELNGRLLDAVTPATLERLTPGRYRIRRFLVSAKVLHCSPLKVRGREGRGLALRRARRCWAGIRLWALHGRNSIHKNTSNDETR